MALQGPIPVEFGHVFPAGVYAAGTFEPVRDFDASSGDRFVQSKDKASGLPLWVVEVIDADPEARNRTVKVKVAAEHQPVLPPSSSGSPFVAVEFAGLTVTPYVTQAGRLAYSLKATGVRAPGRHGGRSGSDTKEAAA
ncbi:MAG TPA: plasmid replication, integration and excision activator [Streptosporangiaceae bacterium]|nr:plasmid replication, integration and excision activator [Streptosporangiaceae bacterium]